MKRLIRLVPGRLALIYALRCTQTLCRCAEAMAGKTEDLILVVQRSCIDDLDCLRTPLKRSKVRSSLER